MFINYVRPLMGQSIGLDEGQLFLGGKERNTEARHVSSGRIVMVTVDLHFC